MTYIIAGNFNNVNFLMVDCISTPEGGDETFAEKLFKLKAQKDETIYCCLTGDGIIMDTINCYDDYLCYENTSIDYEDANTIQNIILQIKNYPLSNSRLYFLKNDKIFYYDLFFENSFLQKIEINYVNQDEYVLCTSKNPRKINKNITDFYAFSKNTIKDYNEEVFISDMKNKILNFKNRFSFICSKDMKLIRPYKSALDFISTQFAGNYNQVLRNT